MRFLILAVVMVFFGCGDRNRGDGIDYLRSPNNFRFLKYSNPSSSQDVFLLTWSAPSRTKGLLGSHVYLDTSNWQGIIKDTSKAPVVLFVPYTNTSSRDNPPDSILIILSENVGTRGYQQIASINGLPTFALDTTNRLDSNSRGKPLFYFGLVSRYSDGELGNPRFTELRVFDIFPPTFILPQIEVGSDSIHISWNRPQDQVSHFESENTYGIIKEYLLTLSDDRRNNPSALIEKLNIKRLRYTVGKNDPITANSGEPLFEQLLDTIKQFPSLNIYQFRLPDQNRFDTSNTANNKISLDLYGLKPQLDYTLSVKPVDSAGNEGSSGADEVGFSSTDTTQPFPVRIDTSKIITEKNKIQFQWDAVRDRYPKDYNASNNSDTIPHTGIKSYHLRQILFASSSRDIQGDTSDIVFNINLKDTLYTDKYSTLTFSKKRPEDSLNLVKFTHHFLPPGVEYQFTLWAEDFSGHKSEQAQIKLKTKLIDSLNCGPGYLPILRNSSKDGVSNFCIESLEHRVSNQKFIYNVDAQTAQEICSQEGKKLCTEAQWESTCKGSSEPSNHRYGVQALPNTTQPGLKLDSNIIRSVCNQGGQDISMARSIDLRPLLCMTNEGVRDMTGQFAEWVDSAGVKFKLKGGHYLNNKAAPGIFQSAQCDYEINSKQIRPKIVVGCAVEQDQTQENSPIHQIAAHYRKANNWDSLHCLRFEKPITKDSISKDSTQLFLWFGNSTKWDSTFKIGDVAQKIKPYKLALAETVALQVDFKRLSNNALVKDTLLYAPFRYIKTEPLVLGTLSRHELLLREFNDQYWEAIPKKYLVGNIPYFSDGSMERPRDVKPYYSHPVIGFRCCSP